MRQTLTLMGQLPRMWTEQECEIVREAYRVNVGSKGPWLKTMAAELKRHPANVVRKAKSLGCVTSMVRTRPFHLRTQYSQWKSFLSRRTKEEKSAVQSERMKRQWKNHPHPKGMLGKRHTPEVRARMSAAHMGEIRPPMTKEHRLRISAAAVKRLGVDPASFSRKLNRGIVGRRVDLENQYFRSRYEANYARFLNFIKTKWEYEKKTFWFLKIKRGVRSYTPDFYLPERKEYHEVKGWMDPKSKTKLKRMKKYYPDVKIVVVDGTWFKAANKQGMCRFIQGWECDHKRH